MVTQEEYMKVQELRAAGWTIVQIAEHVGYHPATVSEWLRHGGPPAEELVVDERWRVRIGQLLERNAALQGSSVIWISRSRSSRMRKSHLGRSGAGCGPR